VVVAGALLVAVAEVAHSFAAHYRGGERALTGGVILCAAGLIGLFVELYPPQWLRAAAARRKAGWHGEPGA
jgi:hypothetical protein